MANPEHLAILKQGVAVWNSWRRERYGLAPDLAGVDLAGAALVGFNFTGTDLRNVNLAEAQLSNSNLLYANLIGANLTDACLEVVNLGRANLTGAVLTRASLMDADLFGAILRDAGVAEANLMHANLSKAKLERASLYCADLRYCIIVGADLTRANLTGSQLYGTATDDWIIDGIECKCVFLDVDGKNRSPQERDFAPGEFERLYRTLPTIEYVFENGMSPMDPLIMDRVVQAIREQNPEFGIKIDSISARGLAPSIKFTVQQEQHKEPALAEVTKIYEAKVHELTGRLDEARAFIQLLIDRPNSVYIENATGQYLAIGGSTINIDRHIEYINNLRDVVAAQPENSPTFAKVAKNTALDILGGALKDVAKGQVKEAAKQIYELGKELGPVIVNTAAYAFFRNCLG